jgi:glycosyltransferase involved in cell wall biosynthesis
VEFIVLDLFIMRFLILVTGWNCAAYVRACHDSLLRQTHKDWIAVFISDGSTDLTEPRIRAVLRDARMNGKIYHENLGAAYRRYQAAQEFGAKTDVILLLGMDDELLPGCLERVAREYKAGKWMTYGNWIDQRKKMLPDDFDLDFDQKTHNSRDYRLVKYRSTAPNTFYKFLFDRIPEEDFKLSGKWIDSTTESEVMFSCLEMCGQQRIGIIKDPIYLYNSRLPTGTVARMGSDYKYQLYNQIIQRPKRELLPNNQFGK